jgi:hypothetical protein
LSLLGGAAAGVIRPSSAVWRGCWCRRGISDGNGLRRGGAGAIPATFVFGETAPDADQRLWLAQRPRPAQVDYETGLADTFHRPGVPSTPGEPREFWMLLAGGVAVPAGSDISDEFKRLRDRADPGDTGVVVPQVGRSFDVTAW